MNKDYEVLNELVDIIFGSKPKKKKKRARNKDGTFKGDNKATKDVNEAWEVK
tara:strand:- start:11634 stop:11789 length:156 start_codon:yes stop_codon:yes gene_type:complete